MSGALTKTIQLRGGREAPRWTLLGIVAVVVGLVLLIAHASVTAIVVGVILFIVGLLVPIVFSRRTRQT